MKKIVAILAFGLASTLGLVIASNFNELDNNDICCSECVEEVDDDRGVGVLV